MVVYILQSKGIPIYDIDTHRNQPANVFQREGYTMLVANSRELRFIIIGSDFKWESSITRCWRSLTYWGVVWPIWRGLRPSIALNKSISWACLLLCKHNNKLHKSKTSNLKHETRMIFTQKRTRIKELTGWSDWEDVVWRHRCR